MSRFRATIAGALHRALHEHRRATILVAAGVLVVLLVSVIVESTNAVMVAGIVAGLLVGVVIASEAARKESANLPPAPRSGRKKKG